MANIDVDVTSNAFDESDFNNCVCAADAVVTTGIASPVPAPLEDVDKLDIYFDIAAAHGPDYSVTPAGDWLPVSGELAYKQSIYRRLITNPGDWATKPEYGAGGAAFLKSKDTKANRDAFAGRIRTQALMDPRTEKVGDIEFERFGDGGRKVGIKLFRKDRVRRDEPVTITIQG